MKLFIAAAVAALSMSLVPMRPAHAEILTPERVFTSPDLSGPRARGVSLSPDGSAVTYLKAKADDQRMTDLWIAVFFALIWACFSPVISAPQSGPA